MARFRKAAALIACAVMASTVTGCADTTYSVKYGDDTVKAGVYIAYLQNELSNQLYTLSYKGVESKDYFSQQVDGVDLAEYVKNKAIKDTKEYVAVKKQFETEGLIKELNKNLNESWDSMSGLYENNGVSKESLKEIYRESLMRTKIFNSYYDEGGKEAPTDDEIQKYVNDGFIRYKMIALYKSTETDESKKNAENEEKLKTRDEYYEKGKNLTFDEFDSLIHEYEDASSAAAAAAAEADSSQTDDSSQADDSSAAGDDTSSVAETSEAESSAAESSESESTAEESSKADESTPDAPNAEESKTSEPESAADSSEADSSEEESAAAADPSAADSSEAESAADTDSSAADTESAADTGSEAEAEAEEDPYEHEVMINLAEYKDEDFETESGKLYKFIKEAEIGKVLTFENDNAYYIVVKGDVSKRTDYVSENRHTLVQSMMEDAFQSKLDAWVEAANISVNEKSVKRYTPEVIYDRMTEYSKKNQKTNG